MTQNSSALRNHFLSSILPYQQVKKNQHFLKNKQFYKPEQFIWNNPHRTSKRLYPYYHQSNEEYEFKIKPQIQKLEQQDRICIQQERIKKLTNLRIQTRQKFFQRQKSREQLQAKSNSRKRQSSTIEPKTFRQQKIPSLKNSIFRTHSTSNHIFMITNANIEQTFTKAIKNYDENLHNIRKLVSDQMLQNHKKIRFNFQKRKENNDQVNGSILGKSRKSVGVVKFDNFVQV